MHVHCATLIAILIKFADDTKSGHVIKSVDDQKLLQECINNMSEWADTWGMTFNAKKCKILHLGEGRENPGYDYFMNGVKLDKVNHEKDIGVKVTNNLSSRVSNVKQGQIWPKQY